MRFLLKKNYERKLTRPICRLNQFVPIHLKSYPLWILVSFSSLPESHHCWNVVQHLEHLLLFHLQIPPSYFPRFVSFFFSTNNKFSLATHNFFTFAERKRKIKLKTFPLFPLEIHRSFRIFPEENLNFSKIFKNKQHVDSGFKKKITTWTQRLTEINWEYTTLTEYVRPTVPIHSQHNVYLLYVPINPTDTKTHSVLSQLNSNEQI